jgi:pimeloyl-ACP methyl ester carboxylesterase
MLAMEGYDVVRLDWHGVGDSSGRVERFDPERPFVEDVLGSVTALRRRGIQQISFVASCFGARTALAMCEQLDKAVIDRLFLVAPPATARRRTRSKSDRLAERWGWRAAISKAIRPSVLVGLRDPRRRRTAARFFRAKVTRGASDSSSTDRGSVSAVFVRDVTTSIDRGAELLLLYGSDDAYLADAQAALNGLDARRRKQVDLEIVPGELHGFQRVESQELVLERARTWARVARRAAYPPRTSALSSGTIRRSD